MGVCFPLQQIHLFLTLFLAGFTCSLTGATSGSVSGFVRVLFEVTPYQLEEVSKQSRIRGEAGSNKPIGNKGKEPGKPKGYYRELMEQRYAFPSKSRAAAAMPSSYKPPTY